MVKGSCRSLYIYIPTTVILVAVVVLSISVVSGPANAFIFFSQVTTTYVDIVFVQFVLQLQAQGSTTYSPKPVLVIGSIYEFFNLSFLYTLCHSSILSD